MFKYFRKYKPIVTTGFLAFYLVGGLQFPVLECLHFFAHADDFFMGNFQKHSYYAHNDGHGHAALDLMDVLDENSEDAKAPVPVGEDSINKKSPQIFASSQIFLTVFSPSGKSDFYLLQGPSLIGKNIPSPPPRV